MILISELIRVYGFQCWGLQRVLRDDKSMNYYLIVTLLERACSAVLAGLDGSRNVLCSD